MNHRVRQFLYEQIFYFFPLFISASTAATNTITTSAKSPIIQIPFSHETKGMDRRVFIYKGFNIIKFNGYSFLKS